MESAENAATHVPVPANGANHAAVTRPAVSDVEIVPIHPEKLDMAWKIVEPWLANALKYGPHLYETSDILDFLKKEEMILWGAIQGDRLIGMSITSLQKFPRALVADIHWTGGDLNKSDIWLDGMMEVLKGWAIFAKADKLAGGGRRGWIKKYGFKECGVMFEMELPKNVEGQQ